MGLFRKKDPEQKVYADAICTIAKEISFGDGAVMREMKACAYDIKRYTKHHNDVFETRGLDTDSENEHKLIWIALTDCLIRHGYAVELDWSCEKDDYIHFVSRLRGFYKFNCEINPVHLYDDDDVASWCAVQDKIWYTKKVCVGAIDIDSDSYVLFVCGNDALERLAALAASVHQRIARGSDM